MLSESYNTQGQKAIFTSTNRISSSVTLLQVPELLSQQVLLFSSIPSSTLNVIPDVTEHRRANMYENHKTQ
jgi:hypothetical protein